MRYLHVVLVTILLLAVSAAAADDTAVKARKQVTTAIDTRRQTQQAEDAWETERVKLRAEYEALEEANRQLAMENQALQKRVAARRSAIDAMRGEIQALQQTSEELSPYLNRLFKRLAGSVADSLPFDLPQRRRRVQRIGRQLAAEDLSIGIRFRDLTDALLVEARYGNSVGVDTRQIKLAGQPVMVRVLRLGRLGLFFLTLDQKTAGTFDPASSSWKMLPGAATEEILKAVQIGSRQRSVELLSLPLGRIARQ